MPREIKFRAWNRVIKEMFDVAIIHDNYIFGYDFDWDNWEAAANSREDCDLMQFTGLLDKNGKELYEGDIVHYWQSIDGRDGTGCHRNLVVDGHETGPLFRVIGLGEYEGPYTTYKMDEMLNPRPFDNVRGNLKIIGNVHENPELLKDVKK